MRLDWELVDLRQRLLTRLDSRKAGSQVELGVNKMRTAKALLSLADDAREKARAIDTVLRVTLKGPNGFSRPLFIGRVVIPSRNAAGRDQQILELNALDPLHQLNNMLVRKVTGSNWEAMGFKGIDQSLIMWSLIESIGGHGVEKGSLPASQNRDRTYPPTKSIGEALLQMSEVINGPDFELEPVLSGDGTLCNFNTFHPRQGEDKSDTVKFVYRAAPRTATGFSYTPAGDDVINRVVAVGAPQQEPTEESPIGIYPAYVAEHAALRASREL
jgi:hypothetical protein